MSDRNDPAQVATSIKGMRHTRRFVDQPVPQAAVEDMIAAARGVQGEAEDAGIQMLVVDDLVTRGKLTTVGVFSKRMAGAALVLVAVQPQDDGVSRMKMESRIADAIMLEARRHGLGAAYGYFHSREAQDEVKAMLGVSGRVLVCVGVGYVDDDPDKRELSLEQVKQALDGLTGNRDRE